MSRNTGIFAWAAVVSLLMTGVVNAASTVVTGGNAGQGVVINPALFDEAFNIGNATSYAVQGENFVGATGAGNTAITLSGTDNTQALTNLPQLDSTTPGTNDYNLSHIYQTLQFGSGVSPTIVLNNLTIGETYTIQALVGDEAGANPRIEDVAFNGVPMGTVNAMANFYNVFGTAIADGSGHITITFTPDISTTDMNPIVNAIIVSTPEPASLGLLAVGGLMLLRRRRV